MASRLKFLAITVLLTDLILLGVIGHYFSWVFVLAFIFFSGLTGGWMLNHGLGLYMKKISQTLQTNQAPPDFIWGMIARVSAGILFIVPGVLTDLMALLLLSPAGKWFARVFIFSFFAEILPGMANQNYFFHPSDDVPAQDEIIDVKVIDSKRGKSGNGR